MKGVEGRGRDGRRGCGGGRRASTAVVARRRRWRMMTRRRRKTVRGQSAARQAAPARGSLLQAQMLQA